MPLPDARLIRQVAPVALHRRVAPNHSAVGGTDSRGYVQPAPNPGQVTLPLGPVAVGDVPGVDKDAEQVYARRLGRTLQLGQITGVCAGEMKVANFQSADARLGQASGQIEQGERRTGYGSVGRRAVWGARLRFAQRAVETPR